MPKIVTGQSIQMNMTVHDPATDEEVQRFYWVNLPKDYNPIKAMPTMLQFHGWTTGPTPYYMYEDLG